MYKMLPVVILAGGLATRLRPITETIPKSLVEVAGEPFLSHQLKYLKDQGIDTVIMCIGHLGEMIQKFVGDGRKFGLKVHYALDGPKLLGTGGAIKQAVLKYTNEIGADFFVLYGDSFLPIDFKPVQNYFENKKLSNKPALMTILKNQNHWDKSNVLVQNGRLIEYNKVTPKPEMTFIDYGLSILSRCVLDKYNQDYVFDLATVFQDLSIHGQLTGYEVFERFYEIGSHTGLKECEAYFLNKGL